METTGHVSVNVKNLYSDTGSTLRYLRGKDKNLIEEDDPGFFSARTGREDTLRYSRLSRTSDR
jgi:hypothetical protein